MVSLPSHLLHRTSIGQGTLCLFSCLTPTRGCLFSDWTATPTPRDIHLSRHSSDGPVSRERGLRSSRVMVYEKDKDTRNEKGERGEREKNDGKG